MRACRLLSAVTLMASVLGCAHPRSVARDGRAPEAAMPARAVALPAPAASHGRALEAAAAAPVIALPAPAIDFGTRIRPLLEARCRPCHFPGGKLYAKLPFDRAETILKLREKLFTRIKAENERQTIREFLAQHPPASPLASHPSSGS